MPKRGLFEDREDYQKRVEHEALEEASGQGQGFLERDEDYAARARKEALEKTSGLHQGFLESEQDFQNRASRQTLENMSGLRQGWLESDAAFHVRALKEILENESGVSQGWLESEEKFFDRAMQELGEDLDGRTSHIYLQKDTLWGEKELAKDVLPPEKEAENAASASGGMGILGLAAVVGVILLVAKFSDWIAFLLSVVLPLAAGLLIKKPWYIFRGALLGYALVSLISFSAYMKVLPYGIYENTPYLYLLILLGMLGGAVVKNKRKSR